MYVGVQRMLPPILWHPNHWYVWKGLSFGAFVQTTMITPRVRWFQQSISYMVCQTIKTTVSGTSCTFPSPVQPVHAHKTDFTKISLKSCCLLAQKHSMLRENKQIRELRPRRQRGHLSGTIPLLSPCPDVPSKSLNHRSEGTQFLWDRKQRF